MKYKIHFNEFALWTITGIVIAPLSIHWTIILILLAIIGGISIKEDENNADTRQLRNQNENIL